MKFIFDIPFTGVPFFHDPLVKNTQLLIQVLKIEMIFRLLGETTNKKYLRKTGYVLKT